MRLWKALDCRPFALLWLGQTISRFGDSIFAIALSWWVLEKTGSPAAMATVQIVTMLPKLLFLLIGGVIADRLPRQRVMLVSDVLRGGLVILLAVLMQTQTLVVWHIYLAGLLFGLVDAFFQPSYAAIVPTITPTDLLPSANSLTALSGQFSGIIGPAIGALIVKLGGTSTAFALDGVSFLVSAGCVLPILKLIVAAKPTDSPPPNAIRELREGIGAVFASPWLWITIGLAAFLNLFIAGPISVSMPFLIQQGLHADVTALGWLFSSFSLGSIVGAVLIGRGSKLRHRGLLTYGGWFVAEVMIGLLGASSSVALSIVIMFIAGNGLAIGQLIWTNVLQELVPSTLLGRVSSVDQFGSFALLPIGYGLAGYLTGRIGAPLVFMLGGGAAAILTALGLLHPAIRNLD